MNLGGPFQAGVDDVGDVGGGEDAEEPSSSREEVLFVAGVVLQVGWKEQRAEGIEEDRVQDNKEVDREGPLRHQREAELPPPEVNDREQKRCRPAEMQDRHLLSLGMLHKPGEDAEKRGDAQTEDDRNDDPGMLRQARGRWRGAST